MALPTDSELEILQIIWQNGPCTVRFVNEVINEKREVGYTSTLKTMQLMMDKKMLSRIIEDRVHYYTAVMDEGLTQKELLSEFVRNTFRGSASSLVMSMLGGGEASPEEISKIKSYIQSIEKNS